MLEELLVTVRDNPKIDPVLGIWSWEVPVYLFAGGLTAGILVFASLMIWLRREDEFPFVSRKLALWAPIVLSVGMGALFLDLEHKLYVWRFYTTFQPASPMSWGSWLLLLIYPVSLLLIARSLREGYPTLGRLVDRFAYGRAFLDFAIRHRIAIAGWGVVLGVFLAIYTGILLSALSARPFWNTGYLGPLFLVSGLSAAAAVILLATPSENERHTFTRIDLGLLVVEGALIGLLIINLLTSTQVHIDSAQLILGGPYTIPFWLWFVLPGLLAPILVEVWEITGKRRAWMVVAPLLVLYGGYMLRQLTVELGQTSTYLSYTNAFDPALLNLLR